jgi:1-pyrroline-5-carboxylate dehydrogenase
MTFKLTYATMFDPPEELHARFDAAMARVRAALGTSHSLYINGADRPAGHNLEKRAPADRDLLIGTFAAASTADAERALSAAHAAWPAWRRTPAAERARLLRRVGQLIEERVYDIAAALTLEVGKNRMEALGEAQ